MKATLLLPALLLGMFVWLPVWGPHASAADAPALVVEQGGLKHLYRVVFREFDEVNNFAAGALEIFSEDDSEVPVMRVPFAAELKADSKDKKVELLEVRCTGLLSFFPPANHKEPYPTLTWKLTGRKAGKPQLVAAFWDYDGKKEAWTQVELVLEKAK